MRASHLSTEAPVWELSALAGQHTVLTGDCIRLMRRLSSRSVDFILTDPPYLCSYRSRTGQTILNDDNAAWLQPAFSEMYRVLKDNSLCMSFYGWSQAALFLRAWRRAGFRIVGHIVFRKRYVSSSRFVGYRHEMAYLLAKGFPPVPASPPDDVVDWVYSGNRLHPTQKAVEILEPFIEAYCPTGGIVFDPFCGSGSTLVAAKQAGRFGLGIELDPAHAETARRRLLFTPETSDV